MVLFTQRFELISDGYENREKILRRVEELLDSLGVIQGGICTYCVHVTVVYTHSKLVLSAGVIAIHLMYGQ